MIATGDGLFDQAQAMAAGYDPRRQPKTSQGRLGLRYAKLYQNTTTAEPRKSSSPTYGGGDRPDPRGVSVRRFWSGEYRATAPVARMRDEPRANFQDADDEIPLQAPPRRRPSPSLPPLCGMTTRGIAAALFIIVTMFRIYPCQAGDSPPAAPPAVPLGSQDVLQLLVDSANNPKT